MAVRVGPGAGDQAPMPAQQRGSEQARPAGSGQHAADRGQQRPVGGLQPESWGLPAQDGELMAWHQDLQVLDGVVMGEQGEELDGSGTAIDRRGSATTRTASEVGSGTALPYPDGLLQLRSSWAMSGFPHPTGCQPPGDRHGGWSARARGAGGADGWAAGLAFLQRQAEIAEQLIRQREARWPARTPLRSVPVSR